MSGDAATGVVAYVFISDLAEHLQLRPSTVRGQSEALKINHVMIRNPKANNQFSRAVTADDAKLIVVTINAKGKLVNNARVLGPDEISRLMEEK